MRRVKLLVNIGRHEAGWGVEVEDSVAALWVQQGKAVYGPANQALKKGSLENYNNCQPLSPKEIAAKRAALKSAISPSTAIKKPEANEEEKAEE